MAVINVGVDFAGAQQASDAQRNPVPVGVYELRVAEILENDDNGQPITSKKGGPMFIAILEVINASDPNLNGKKFKKWVIVPTKGDLSAVGFLVDFAKACGKPWSGASFDPQDFMGSVFRANVGVTPAKEEGKTGFNQIESYL